MEAAAATAAAAASGVRAATTTTTTSHTCLAYFRRLLRMCIRTGGRNAADESTRV